MAEREIILVRHAHAEPASAGQDDIARVLSLRGEAEADAAGAWLKRHAAAPARVLCSPAARARETCERVLAAIGYTDLRSEARIYEATPGTLLRVLDDHADANPLLLVGHIHAGIGQLHRRMEKLGIDAVGDPDGDVGGERDVAGGVCGG